MPKQRLQGQVAIVTGASRGIGAATARLLAQEGSVVVLTARDEGWLESVARDVRERGGNAIAVAADITDLDHVEEVVESALGQFDKVDIVVNAVGNAWPMGAVADTDAEEWAYGIHANLVGPFYVVSNVLPLMIEQGYGRVVNLTCHSGSDLTVGASALLAAKAGLETWTQVVAKEVDGTGVVISCLDPGVVDTGTRREIVEMDPGDDTVDISSWIPNVESDQLCSPEEAAQMVLRLVTVVDENRPGHVYRGSDLI